MMASTSSAHEEVGPSDTSPAPSPPSSPGYTPSKQPPPQHSSSNVQVDSENKQCVIHCCFKGTDKCYNFTEKTATKVLTVAEIRRENPTKETSLLNVALQVPDNIDTSENSKHGYHRLCYQRFTTTRCQSKPTKRPSEVTGSNENATKKRRSSTETAPLFPNICIICSTAGRKWYSEAGRRKSEGLRTCQTAWAETQIKTTAEQLQDHVFTQVKDGNLRAREAKYHPTCYKHYILKTKKVQERREKQDVNKSWAKFFDYVEDEIVCRGHVKTINELKEKLISIENEDGANIRKFDSYIKARLESQFGKDLQFYESEKRTLVFSQETPFESVVKTIDTNVPDEIRVQEVALYLRKCILESWENACTQDTPWPPSVQQLTQMEHVPEQLSSFLKTVISVKPDNVGAKTNIHAKSIAQDLCLC